MQSPPFFIPRAGLVSIERIDREHREVVDALEEVRVHVEEQPEVNLRKTRDIGKLLVAHFRSEEQLMHSYEYPQVSQHTIHHDQTLGAIYRILGNCEIEGCVTLENLRDLYRTLIDDIFSADVAFSNYLASQGKL